MEGTFPGLGTLARRLLREFDTGKPSFIDLARLAVRELQAKNLVTESEAVKLLGVAELIIKGRNGADLFSSVRKVCEARLDEEPGPVASAIAGAVATVSLAFEDRGSDKIDTLDQPPPPPYESTVAYAMTIGAILGGLVGGPVGADAGALAGAALGIVAAEVLESTVPPPPQPTPQPPPQPTPQPTPDAGPAQPPPQPTPDAGPAQPPPQPIPDVPDSGGPRQRR
jgi:hypothetical protein